MTDSPPSIARPHLALLVACAALAVATPARAQSEPDAVSSEEAAVEPETSASDPEALVQEGIQLRREGRDADALVRFESALALARAPRTLGQAGLAAHASGQWVLAERYLVLALAASDDEWIARNGETLQQMLAEAVARLGSLEISGGVAGATVTIDGREMGTLPLGEPLRLVAGTFTLDVRAEGHYPLSRIVVVPPQRLVREAIDMAPLPPPAPTPLAPTEGITTHATVLSTESAPVEAAPEPTPAAPEAHVTPPVGATAAAVRTLADAPLPDETPARERDEPDAYVGFFFVFGPTARSLLMGGDLRVSVPVAELGTEHLALTLGFELGALYGDEWTPSSAARTGERPRYQPPDYELDGHVGLTPGIRARFGVLSLGMRAGYELWVSQEGYTAPHFVLSHAGVVGVEIGFGVPLFTVTASFDLHVTGDGWVMPLTGAGVCF